MINLPSSNTYLVILHRSWPKTTCISWPPLNLMDLQQTEDDQSFQDLLSACQEGFKRPRHEISSTGQQKNGREQRKRNSTSSTSTSDSRNGDLVQMLGRLVLRQEDTLNQLGLDRSLMVFLQCGKGSLMPSLLELGKKWNARKQAGETTTSLRQTMFQAVFTKLITRAGKLNLTAKDDALVQGLKAKGILTEDLKWQNLSWNPEAKALQPNQKTPLTSDDVCQTLRRIHQLGENPNLVLKFAALRPLSQDSLPQDAAIAIPWRLDVSLRGPEAQELHMLLLKLAGNGVTQLILMRMRQTTLQRSPLAVAISHRLRKS